jgi:S-adenosylmethionine:tRNA ribosyltransferase-isomerase
LTAQPWLKNSHVPDDTRPHKFVLKLSQFDYELSQELIAQEPLRARDQSRLLHLGPGGTIAHRRFDALPELLEPGDLLVVNETKVFPARLLGTRPTGGAVELLLLENLGDDTWTVLGKPAKKLRVGTRLSFGDGALEGEVIDRERLTVRFDYAGDWDTVVDALGRTPLPPYIRPRDDEHTTRERYQTVYAKTRGSIAAPTAGLHFTDAIFDALAGRGVDIATITLHVGYATFEPVRTDDVSHHRMGVEHFEVPSETVERIRSSQRVVAVGTTTVRALESAAERDFAPGWHASELFITPGFEFRVVGGLVTNFHLPKSTLLMLVCALGGTDNVLAAYREAVERKYRFYSFGDAMLVYPV